MENGLEPRVHNFILERFPLARKRSLGTGDDLLDSGILDSLGVLELVTFLEEELGVLIVDDELVPENFSTVERLARFAGRKMDGSGESP